MLVNKNEQDQILTRKDVAKRLNISLPTLNKYTKEGVIPCFKLGPLVRYRLSEINSLKGTQYVDDSI